MFVQAEKQRKRLTELEQAQAGFGTEVARLSAQLDGANELARSREAILEKLQDGHQVRSFVRSFVG